MLLVVIIKVLRCDEHRLLPSPHLVPSQFPVRNAVESGEDIHSDTRGQDRGRVSAGDIEWAREMVPSSAVSCFTTLRLYSNTLKYSQRQK